MVRSLGQPKDVRLCLHTSKLICIHFNIFFPFSFHFLVNQNCEQFSLQDNDVGSLLYGSFVKYLYFPSQSTTSQ